MNPVVCGASVFLCVASSLAGAAPVPVALEDDAISALWSEDGSRIAVTTEKHSVVSIDAKTGLVRTLASGLRRIQLIFFDTGRLVVETDGELLVHRLTPNGAQLETKIDVGHLAMQRIDQDVIDADVRHIMRCTGTTRFVATRAVDSLVVIDAAAGREERVIRRRDLKGRELLGCAGNDLFIGAEAPSADRRTTMVRIDLASGQERERTHWERGGAGLAANRRGQLLLYKLYMADTDPGWLRLVDARKSTIAAQTAVERSILGARFQGPADELIATDAHLLDGATLAERWNKGEARVSAVSPDGTRAFRYFDGGKAEITTIVASKKR